MSAEAPRPSLMKSYRPGLRSVVGASATAYGYTLTVGPTSNAVNRQLTDHRSRWRCSCSAAGAIAAFALVGALAFGGMTEHFAASSPKDRVSWAASGSFRRGLAVGAAYLVGAFVPSALVGRCRCPRRRPTYLMAVGFEKHCGRSGAQEELGLAEA